MASIKPNIFKMMNKVKTSSRKLSGIVGLIGATFFLAQPITVHAEPTPPVGTPSALAQPVAVSSQESTETIPTGNVTLDFKDADIRSVLRIISLKSGVNIVSGAEVQGLVSIRLSDVPWEKALEVVLKTYGFAYEKDENIIRVTTIDNLSQEPLETRVFSLTYANATETQTTLQEMLSERGSIRADERTNLLIVTDIPTNTYKIEKVIDRMDRGTPQVLIEAKIIEMSINEAERNGIKWNAAIELRGSSRPTTFPWDFTRSAENIDRYFPRGKPADSVVTITETGAAGQTIETAEDFPTNNRAGRSTPAPTFPFATPTDFVFGKVDTSQFQILMEAIKANGSNKILSEPRITVLSNQEAKILVGEELYIPNYERNSETGAMEITGYIPRNLGIEMVVTPQINKEKEVKLRLAPSISNLIGFEELTPDVRVPRIAIRNASTSVRIANGQTIVLGGLIKEDLVDTITKFPVLGDLPIFDRFFKHTDKTVNKTDLVFFITVTVLEEPGMMDVFADGKASLKS